MTNKKTARMFGVAPLALVFVGGIMAQNNSIPGDNPAQDSEKKVEASTPAVTIPLSTGTAINASLVGTLDSERCKPGDPVSAIVTEPVVYQRSVLLPKGSKIVGHVVRTGAGDGDGSSALFVEFDRAVLKDGQAAVLNAGIQALAPAGTAPTIPSREKYEESRMAGLVGRRPEQQESSGTVVLPSTYTLPRRAIAPNVRPDQPEGGIDRKGLFTPDSKGAFSDPNLRVFTPVSEGSHGTVLVADKKNIHLENGTHLLIVVQPPAAPTDAR